MRFVEPLTRAFRFGVQRRARVVAPPALSARPAPRAVGAQQWPLRCGIRVRRMPTDPQPNAGCAVSGRDAGPEWQS